MLPVALDSPPAITASLSVRNLSAFQVIRKVIRRVTSPIPENLGGASALWDQAQCWHSSLLHMDDEVGSATVKRSRGAGRV